MFHSHLQQIPLRTHPGLGAVPVFLNCGHAHKDGYGKVIFKLGEEKVHFGLSSLAIGLARFSIFLTALFMEVPSSSLSE